MGFGGFYLVTPNKAVSQTITSYDEAKIVNPSEVYETPDSERVTAAYASYLLTQKAEKLVGTYGGACVSFARNFTGATPDVVGGMARNVPTNTTTPDIGEIIKTDESPAGHLGVVIAIDGDTLTVVDSNYHWDNIIHIRIINLNDPKILGYIKL